MAVDTVKELSCIDDVRHKQYLLLWRFPIFILQLDNVLTYHVVSGNVQAADLKDGELIPTLVRPTESSFRVFSMMMLSLCTIAHSGFHVAQ